MVNKKFEENEMFLRDILYFNPSQMMNIMTSSMSIESGGWVRYNRLSKKYSEEDDSYFWESEPPLQRLECSGFMHFFLWERLGLVEGITRLQWCLRISGNSLQGC